MVANDRSSEVTCVTGVAGFIGFHVARKLIEMNRRVVGIDVVNDYYDVSLKEARLRILASQPLFHFERADVAEPEAVRAFFARHSPSTVIHLAAQAGVRYSLEHPQAYVRANLAGFVSILEACRHSDVSHLTYASSSSVYGANKTMPFSVHDNVDHPLSMYAATKKANELMAHTYSHLFKLPTTGLRFFTVYGPWGRPDMAMFIFAKAIMDGRPITLFNEGKMLRDFTYIDDIVEGVIRTSDRIASPNCSWNGDKPDPGTSLAPFRVYNIGNNSPVELMYLVSLLEQELGRKAEKRYSGMQPGDVPATCADIEDLSNAVGFRPSTSIEEGVKRFVAWYKEYHCL
jgi:UDP-glucuronate 4-epimerase